MTTLCISDNFDKMERIILSKTFKANCKFLGIEKYDCSVNLNKWAYSPDERKEGRMLRLPEEGNFLIDLNSIGFHLVKAISVLGHEMIHVSQYLRGDMADDLEGDITEWKGERWPAFLAHTKSFYEKVPWEKEAHGNQMKLFVNAIDSISRDDRDYLLSLAPPEIMAKVKAKFGH